MSGDNKSRGRTGYKDLPSETVLDALLFYHRKAWWQVQHENMPIPLALIINVLVFVGQILAAALTTVGVALALVVAPVMFAIAVGPIVLYRTGKFALKAAFFSVVFSAKFVAGLLQSPYFLLTTGNLLGTESGKYCF